jgi:hypothetical protein
VVGRLFHSLGNVAERRDGVPELHPALLTRCRGHDFFQLRDRNGEDEVGVRRRSGDDRYVLLL